MKDRRTGRARLILLNGTPGIGKSTLARRWAGDHPGTMVVDIDLLRTWVGGWREDFVGTGELVRRPARALVAAYLASGDVIVPQLLADADQVALFAEVAAEAGADFVHVLLRDPAGRAAARFRRRAAADPWHHEVFVIVEESGGDAFIDDYQVRLDAMPPSADLVVLDSIEGAQDETYGELVRLLGS